jgi:tryptophan synthase beta chain
MKGHFGKYGGRYVPEMLIPALEELEQAYEKAKEDPQFKKDFEDLLRNFSGRPTPLVFAKNLTEKLGGAKIYLKNEGLNHTGAHKITHCLGQALIAKRLGKTRLIAETGAGQHGVATATVAAKLGFSCTVYMGEVDVARQRPNVFLMEQLGATVVPVAFGSRTLKDAVNAAIKDWIENVGDTHYLLGSALGPHPFPTMNRDFQSIIGKEIKQQLNEQEKILPDYLIACVGGGSNALGAFTEFINEQSVKLIGVEAGGKGKEKGENAIRFETGPARNASHSVAGGKVGVVEGYKSYFLQDGDGNIEKTHSISAGLDYAGVGPELAYLRDNHRVEFVSASDKEVLEAVQVLAKTEGIIPALESAHAVAHALKLAPTLSKEKIIVVNLSGRGDKDLFILTKAFKDQKFYEFMKKQVEEGYE